MAIELPDGRSESNDVLDALRLRAVHARELGYAVVDIAAILGVREETVSRWCSRYDQGGQEALPGDRTGRPIGSGLGNPAKAGFHMGLPPATMVSFAPGMRAAVTVRSCSASRSAPTSGPGTSTSTSPSSSSSPGSGSTPSPGSGSSSSPSSGSSSGT